MEHGQQARTETQSPSTTRYGGIAMAVGCVVAICAIWLLLLVMFPLLSLFVVGYWGLVALPFAAFGGFLMAMTIRDHASPSFGRRWFIATLLLALACYGIAFANLWWVCSSANCFAK